MRVYDIQRIYVPTWYTIYGARERARCLSKLNRKISISLESHDLAVFFSLIYDALFLYMVHDVYICHIGLFLIVNRCFKIKLIAIAGLHVPMNVGTYIDICICMCL